MDASAPSSSAGQPGDDTQETDGTGPESSGPPDSDDDETSTPDAGESTDNGSPQGDGTTGGEATNSSEDPTARPPEDGMASSINLGEADSATCGDGVVHIGEECDTGGQNADAPDTCRTDCTAPSCGDGIVDSLAGEQCDPGAASSEGCNAECQSGCGNGIVAPGEECDSGSANSNTQANSCRSDCTAARCGDGVVDDAEACDEAAANSDVTPSACRSNCQRHSCGDGVVDLNEGCDDGAGNSDAADANCSSQCQLASCGNGQVDAGEQCDDGAGNSDTTPGACRTNCRTAVCGDGVQDTSELCDNGSNNSNTQPNACRSSCTPSDCGDGVVDDGEECDGGSECNAECLTVGCNNGRLDPGEECDPPTEGSCTAACLAVECGNGRIDPGETCEPPSIGNCTASCSFSQCGDGVVEGEEECEPGVGDVSCTQDCTLSVCGDGIISGTEVCDSGDSNGTYGFCNEECTGLGPRCGDGAVDAPNEVCDDANNDPADGCNACSCTSGWPLCNNACVDPSADATCGITTSCTVSPQQNCAAQGLSCQQGTCVAPGWVAAPGGALAGHAVRDPVVGVDGQGNLVVAWVHRPTGSDDELWTNRYSPQTQWLEPEEPILQADGIYDVSIAVSESGPAVVVWELDDDIGAAWLHESEVRVEEQLDLDDLEADHPVVAISASGVALALWDEDDGTDQVVSRRIDANGVWASDTQSVDSSGSDRPSVAIIDTPSGVQAVAAWEETGDEVRMRHYADSWGPRSSSTDDRDSQDPQVVMVSPNGTDGADAIAAWEQDDADNDAHIVAKYFDGESWGGVTTIDNGSEADGGSLRLDSNDAGTVFAVWLDYDDNILVNRYVSGPGWSGVANLGPGEQPSLSVDGQGRAFLVWEGTFQGLPHVVVAMYDGQWSSPMPLPGGAGGTEVRVGSSLAGVTAAVWRNGNALGAAYFP